jgi:hypothetical protein
MVQTLRQVAEWTVEIPARLISYAVHTFGKIPQKKFIKTTNTENIINNIYLLMHPQTSYEFSGYKQNTIMRCNERLMAVQHFGTMEEYAKFESQTTAVSKYTPPMERTRKL